MGKAHLLLLLVATCSVYLGASLDIEFKYHNYTALTAFLQAAHGEYPHLTHLYSIGKSVQGRQLHVIALGKNPNEHMTLRPHVKYVGNMHGNEVVGREVLLHFIHNLLTSYGTDEEVTSLMNNTVIHVLPSMNPDGFEISHEGQCRGVWGRRNMENMDLNRNFPDQYMPSSSAYAVETRHVMQWVQERQFVLSANLHGGALVANYPFDAYPGSFETRYSKCPDDDVFVHLASTYARAHGDMVTKPCRDRVFDGGITNGAAWYPVWGSMQDYNYVEAGCLEVLMEISCCKYPFASNLSYFWRVNKPALMQYIQQVHIGVKGRVFDEHNNTVSSGMVRVRDREIYSHLTPHGEFWKLLLPGKYQLEVSIPGHTQVVDITVGKGVTHHDVHLLRKHRKPHTTTTTVSPTSVVTSGDTPTTSPVANVSSTTTSYNVSSTTPVVGETTASTGDVPGATQNVSTTAESPASNANTTAPNNASMTTESLQTATTLRSHGVSSTTRRPSSGSTEASERVRTTNYTKTVSFAVTSSTTTEYDVHLTSQDVISATSGLLGDMVVVSFILVVKLICFS